ncbi:MAG: TolC family protein [Oscillospiraceae bacterium]|nr:TolC family protein [Oscillospiraceae bacterium]
MENTMINANIILKPGIIKSAAAMAIALSVSAASLTMSAAATTTAASAAANIPRYPEARGIVDLTLATMNARIAVDNEDYKVSQKRVDIYQRRLASAMHDKYLAENKDPPQPVFSAQRVAYEKQLYIDWRNAELEHERYLNELSDKLDRIKSSLKKQYTDILDLERALKTYDDEMEKLNANIEQLTAQINVGVAKPSDMDVYTAQKMKLEADIAARQRDIELAKYNLKADLKIDQYKEIRLGEYNEQFIRFNDVRIERLVSDAVDGSFAVNSNDKKLQILKDERAIMLQWDREGAMLYNLQNNEVSIKETEYALINARKTEESGLWSDYYSLLNQEDQIEIERMNVQIAENDYNIVVARLNQGLVTPLDEQNARLALENAKTTHQTAINNYMRMSGDFQLRLAK